ncbi:MAG TPA: hypothetical protein VHZ97_04985, partial [Pseudonocardiaceae bacterium]|nr:hypothetical protein [Pseudonocardiaceae bacterium]
MAVVADAEIDSSAEVFIDTTSGVRAVRPVGTVIHRPVRMRPVRLVRAGDRRRPGHVVTAPSRRARSVACAPRS